MSDGEKVWFAAFAAIVIVAAVLIWWTADTFKDGYRDGQIDAAAGKWAWVKVNGEWVHLEKPATRPVAE